MVKFAWPRQSDQESWWSKKQGTGDGASPKVLESVPRRREETDGLVLSGGVAYDLAVDQSGTGEVIMEGDCNGEVCREGEWV
jgi:hypothetical protein